MHDHYQDLMPVQQIDLCCTLQSFDEMLLMKRGGRIIYFGPLGPCSSDMVQYFEVSLPGTLLLCGPVTC
jgi:hypothetical protein